MAPYYQIRCSVLPMLETMQLLKESHLELLQKTPFWPLLEAFHNGNISELQCKDCRTPIRKITKTFNPKTASFHFGTRAISINTEDISRILGLPQQGDTVQFGHLVYRKSYKSDFTERHFKGIERVNHKLLHGLLLKLLNRKEQTDIEDVVRLTLMELFITFLFTRSHLQLVLVKYCDEFDKLSRYSWAAAVGEFLNKSLKAQSKVEIEGCALLIPLWLCEKTNITQPISGREIIEGNTPSLIRWSLPELNIKMQEITICEIERLFEVQNGIEVEIKPEHENHEGEEEELKKKDTKQKGRELYQPLQKEIVERRKVQKNDYELNVKNNFKDKLKAEVDGEMELIEKDQLDPQIPCTAIQLSPRDDNEVLQVGHQMRLPMEGSGVKVRKQQLDPDFVCNVVPERRKAKEQHAPSDPILTVPTRAIQDPAAKRDEQIIIIVDDSVSEEEKSTRKVKRTRKECFPLERCEIFKLLDDEYQQKVKAFWSMTNPKELFWSGKNASVACEDVKKLIKNTAVASNVIDAFMELLEQKQHQSSVKQSTYISTLCWNYVRMKDARKKGKKDQVQDEVHDEVGLNQLVFDPLLGSMAQSDYIFFPIISKFHYTLLVLNKNEKKWTHYNPSRKRSELHIDPCYEVAKQMHQLTQEWFRITQKEAPRALLKGTKRKKMGKREDWMEVPLSEDEKRTLTWMMDNNIDFKIENDRISPQQDFKSLDCGIFVMYYMNQLSQGLQLEKEITECRMWEFRKNLIKLFLDHENGWKQTSTT
ncbi:hypothetical protein ABKV19_000246 [Rosa sericea]